MTAARTAALRARVGDVLGTTSPHLIAQSEVDCFGAMVDDRQWIHVDPRRAAANGPFGGAIVHGALLLAHAATFAGRLLPADGAEMVINGGISTARLRAPVPVGSRISGTVKLVDVEDLAEATVADLQVSVRVEGERDPAVTLVMKLIVHG